MSFFTQLTNAIRWASGGTVAIWTEADRQAGWEKIGATAPSRTEFNMYQQDTDDKILWLFRQLKTLADERGIVMAEADYTLLKTIVERPASESNLGVVRIATTAETNALALAGKFIDPQKLGGLFAGITIRNVTASRALGVTYTNTSKVPRLVNIQGATTMAAGGAQVTVAGIPVVGSSYPDVGRSVAVTAFVPVGANYVAPTGEMTLARWTEFDL